MGKILTGKEPAAAVLEDIKKRIAKLGRAPGLAIIQIGDNPASELYVGKKLRKAEEIGIAAKLHKLPENAKESELLKLVDRLNNDESVDGFIVQLPLPKHINAEKIIERIRPEKDADGFTPTNIGKLVLGMPEDDIFLPATPHGIIRMLEFYKVQIGSKHAVVVGRSNIVGKPVAVMLLNRNATVTVCHSRTRNLAEYTSKADILVVAVGKPGIITADMVKEDAVVIDVGTTKVESKTMGDVEFEQVIKKADCSPVPKGVGPMTVAMLLHNVTTAAERRK
jgi:methylenetetrahydrofolate dehydrogenase (NADP+)/methenyltetrahydrofolate cyclohydrolase